MLVLLICLMWLSWRRYVQLAVKCARGGSLKRNLACVLAENRRLAQENLRIQEIERKHLARELHDELGQYLNAIKLDAVSIRESGGTDAEFSIDASLSIIRAVDHVHGAVSDMIGRLRPVGLDELGLVAAIEHCVDQWRQRLPDTTIRIVGARQLRGPERAVEPDIVSIDPGRPDQHLQTCQCAAGEDRFGADSSRRDSGIGRAALGVADDGCGMESSTRTSRFGLSGMRERVEMAGGTFVLESAPGRGLRFEARLPAKGRN